MNTIHQVPARLCSVDEGFVAGEIDGNTISEPVTGFGFGEQDLMANRNLEGAEITKLDKS